MWCCVLCFFVVGLICNANKLTNTLSMPKVYNTLAFLLHNSSQIYIFFFIDLGASVAVAAAASSSDERRRVIERRRAGNTFTARCKTVICSQYFCILFWQTHACAYKMSWNSIFGRIFLEYAVRNSASYLYHGICSIKRQ